MGAAVCLDRARAEADDDACTQRAIGICFH